MKVNVCEQYYRGRKLKKKFVLENVDLNLAKGEATIFSEPWTGPMPAYPLKVFEVGISADGMLLKGVQESSFETWARQEWWCTPVKSKDA